MHILLLRCHSLCNYSCNDNAGGFISQAAKRKYNLELNAAMISYKSVTVDIFSWYLNEKTNIFSKATHLDEVNLLGGKHSFPSSIILPLTRHVLGDKYVNVPANPWALLYLRYPSTLNRTIPYKVSCYLPWHWPELWRIMQEEVQIPVQ